MKFLSALALVLSLGLLAAGRALAVMRAGCRDGGEMADLNQSFG